MTAVAAKSNERDAHLSSLLLQHGQAMKAGDLPRALAVLTQAQALSAPTGDSFPVIGAGEIFAELPPINYVIQAFDLCPGAPAMVAGYGYSAKTITLQAIGLGLAARTGTVLGCFAASLAARVLHLDYEQGSRLTRERYQRLAMPLMIGPDDLGDRLSLVTMPTRYLDQPTAETELERLVVGYHLVIVDSLRAAAPTLDENSSEVRRVLDMMSRVSERTGAAFVVIHHARKPNANQQGGAKMAIRGSGALFDACGSVLVFEAEKGQPVRVSHEKARASGILTDDFELDVSDVSDGANPRAGLLVTASAARSREEVADEAAKHRRLARATKLRDELVSLFEREPDQGGADDIAAKLGRKAQDVRFALRGLVVDGLVREHGKTKDRGHQWRGRE